MEPHERSPNDELTQVTPAADPQGAATPALAPKRPRVWTVFGSMLLSIVLTTVTQALVIGGVGIYFRAQGVPTAELNAQLESSLTSPSIFILLLIVGPGVFGLVAYAAAQRSAQGWIQRLGLVPVQLSPAIYPLSLLGSVFVFAVSMGMAAGLAELVPELPQDDTAKNLLEKMTPFWAIPFVVVIGLVPGFCEEMLFRGYVQRRLIARWNPFCGITLTSISFGLFHVLPTAIVFATVIGFYLGILAWKSGSIWPTIWCHLFINSGVNLWRVVIKFADVSEFLQLILNCVFVVMGLVGFVATLWLLFRRAPELAAQ